MKLIFCVFLFFLPTQILSECPENGVEFQNRCYIFYENATNLLDAEFACLGMNGHLASLHDGFTNAMVASESKNFLHSTKEFWIGLNTLEVTGIWSWTDNTTFGFEQWGPSEPQNVSQSCAALQMLNGYWKSDDCFQTKAFACETSLTATTCISPTPITAGTSSSPSYPAYVNCTEGWIYFEPTHSCYGQDGYNEDDQYFKNWSWGEQYCQSIGGHLPSIHSYDEIRFISTLESFSYYFLWTGLYSIDNGFSWRWSDNSPVDYLPWGPGYPKLNVPNLNANAIFDYNCTDNQWVICKKPANVTNLPTPVTPSYPAYMNCTEGWIYFEPTHSCYGHDGYDYQTGNWLDAQQYCETIGGHLPSLHSYDETRFLTTSDLFGDGIYWTGLRSYDNELSWKWSDDSPVDYLPWGPGYPNLNVSSCVGMAENSIFDSDCTWNTYVICKKPLNKQFKKNKF